jgi:cell division protein ZapA
VSEENVPVLVHILGKEYRIACKRGEEDALLESARYLDDQMREVKQRGNVIGTDRLAVLVALHMATELLKYKGTLHDTATDSVSRRMKAMQRKIESAIEEAKPYI